MGKKRGRRSPSPSANPPAASAASGDVVPTADPPSQGINRRRPWLLGILVVLWIAWVAFLAAGS